MGYYVYILTNKTNTSLYTGVTNNLERRVLEHKGELIEGFTKRYNLTKLIFFEEFNNVEDALRAEKKIKGWLRIKKINLIQAKNPNLNDLAEEILR
ncbi:MAG: GIY-YIG nuclease family protein [bacterium]|nr:GIY-YIG nuclease family protein [bacterium]